MKPLLGILLMLTTSLVALPTSAVRACGDSRANHNAATSVQTNDEHCATAEDECVETHPGQDCPPDTDGCGKCHCPGCGATGATLAGFFKNHFVELAISDWSYSDRVANFCYNVPSTSAHLAALFRPPISQLI